MVGAGAGMIACVALAWGSATLSAAPQDGALPPAWSPPALPDADGRAQVTEVNVNRLSGVCSAWLANGVRVHHRFMKEDPGRVVVTINVAGGELLETAAGRGITHAAVVAWRWPAARSASRAQVAEFLKGRDLRVEGRTWADGMMLRVSGPVGELEAGLRLARVLLLEPAIEARALEDWKRAEADRAERRGREGREMIQEAMSDLVFPAAEVRARPATAEMIRRIKLDGQGGAQAWLDERLRTGPIEASIVGDVPLAEALRLAGACLGSLPERPRVSATTYADKRKVERPAGPVKAWRAAHGGGPEGERGRGAIKGYVVAGFFGADVKDLDDHRALAVGARIVQTRLNQRLRAGDAPDAGGDGVAKAIPATVYPGFGMVLAAAGVETGQTDKTLALVEEVLREMSQEESGPTEEEVRAAGAHREEGAERYLTDLRFWGGQLASSTYHGYPPDEISRAASVYREMTPARVMSAMKKYDVPAGRIGLMVEPGKEVEPR